MCDCKQSLQHQPNKNRKKHEFRTRSKLKHVYAVILKFVKQLFCLFDVFDVLSLNSNGNSGRKLFSSDVS